MTWFDELTGFRESDPGQVRRDIDLVGETSPLFTPELGVVVVSHPAANPRLGRLEGRSV